jgi:hypothetical protein
MTGEKKSSLWFLLFASLVAWMGRDGVRNKSDSSHMNFQRSADFDQRLAVLEKFDLHDEGATVQNILEREPDDFADLSSAVKTNEAFLETTTLKGQ